jgi:anti-anti-sigma factor
MRIEKNLADTHAELTLRGDFETSDVAAFLAEIDELRAGRHLRVVVNLRMVKFMNSTAVGTLVKAQRALEADGGELALLKPSPICREIIGTLGLGRIVPLFDELDAAVAYLQDADATATTTSTGDGVKPGDTTVLFSFRDDRASMFKRRRQHGVATIEDADANGIRFAWNAARHELEPAQIEKMFAKGSTIRTKFQLKLLRKAFFNAEATVERIDQAGGNVKVTAIWSHIDDADRRDLAQYKNDLAYLKQEMRES